MNFGHPHLLLLLWLVPLAAWLLVLGHRRRRRRLLSLAGAAALWRGRVLTKAGFCLLAIAALCFALAQPRWGFRWTEVKRHGSDLVIAVDVSSSMLAQDINPSRLERAKYEISDLLAALKGDRIGLVAFAGDAFIECPLTEDYNAMHMFVNYLSPDLIPLQGTDLGAAIDTSLKALTDGSPDGTEGRAIILITDGEDQEHNAEKAALAAKEKGVRLYTIGIGSREGAPIPLPEGGFKKDAEGNMVVTKPDETGLANLAVATGGVFVRSVAGGMDLARLYQESIRKDVSQHDYKATRERLWFERFQWFVALALLCLCADAWLSDVRSVAALLLLCPLLANSTARAESARPLLERFNAAVEAYKKGDFGAAASGFQAAGEASDQALAERSLFNLGAAQVQLGKLDEAIKAYENALALNPQDREARDNLEYVKKLKDQQQQNQASKQPQDQQSQGQTPPQSSQDDKQQSQQGQAQSAQQQRPEAKPPSQEQAKSDQARQDQQQGAQGSAEPPKGAQKPAGAQPQEPPPEAAGANQGDKNHDDKSHDDKNQAAKREGGAPADQPKANDQRPGPESSNAQPKPEAAADKAAGADGHDAKDQDQTGEQKQQAGAQEGAGEAAGKPQMSQEEAQKLLRSVDDQVKKYLYSPRSKNPPRSREKDW